MYPMYGTCRYPIGLYHAAKWVGIGYIRQELLVFREKSYQARIREFRRGITNESDLLVRVELVRRSPDMSRIVGLKCVVLSLSKFHGVLFDACERDSLVQLDNAQQSTKR